MTDAELTKMLRSSANRVVNYAADRIEALTAERDAAYARGYSDAETEISKSALGQKNDFLHFQYANAADRIEALIAHYEVLWETNLRIGIERDKFKLRAEKAEAERDQLRLYARHDDDCTVNRYPSAGACSCGLRAAHD